MPLSKPLKSIILVLGMHRSGTSLVTHLVAAEGFSLPDNIVKPHLGDNPGGYQESRDVLYINNLFLKKIGSHWQDPGCYSATDFSGDAAEKARDRIRDFLQAISENQEHIVLKDPRLCRLLPLWLPVLYDYCENIGVIHVFRSQEEIYRSLSKRLQFRDISGAGIHFREHSDVLWWRYASEAVINCKDINSQTVDYAAMLENPEPVIKLLKLFLSSYTGKTTSNISDIVIRRQSPIQLAPDKRQKDVEGFLDAAYETFSGKSDRLSLINGNDDSLRVPPGPWNMSADTMDVRVSCAGILKELSGSIPHFSAPAGRAKWWKKVIHKVDRNTLVFISHNSLTKGHIYRVKNPVDALNRIGIRSIWLDLETASRQIQCLERARCVIFHRCAWNNQLASIFSYCRRHNVVTGFDIDDLLFEPERISNGEIEFINKLDTTSRVEWLAQAEGYRKSARHADFMIVSTNSLAQHAERIHPEVSVIPNGISLENLELANLRRRERTGETQIIRIGYASGTPTHQGDFSTVAPALWHLMANNSAIQFRVIGPLELDPPPGADISARIERVPLTSNINLSRELACFDINLVPLQKNAFSEAKSPLKFIEAALVSVPSIAVYNATYAEVIRHGENGLLADSKDDWLESISQLVSNRDFRYCMGETARAECESTFLADNLVSPYLKLAGF